VLQVLQNILISLINLYILIENYLKDSLYPGVIWDFYSLQSN